MYRLKSLYVKDFRSIDGVVDVSLDAPIVLIHGPNGAGKTSLLSAIELALTGGVPALSRAEPDYLAYLPHKDRPFGEIRLEISEADGALRSGEFRVTTDGISGAPLLQEPEASFFSERSYLAQSTLGRLLEIYQHTDKKSDSPLTRFVKELLGLDRMEAMIGGLYSAGNIARLKIPVPAYGLGRDDIPVIEKSVADLRRQDDEIAARLAETEPKLRDTLSTVDPSLLVVVADLPELARRLKTDPEELELVDLVRARRELDVSQASMAATSTSPGAAERAKAEADQQIARSNLEAWRQSQAPAINALLTRAAGLFVDLSVSEEASFVDRARSLETRITGDLTRVGQLISSHELALARRNETSQQLDEVRARVARLDTEIEAAAESDDGLAEGLSELAEHIHGEQCPVCDRDFSQVSTTPLHAYLTAKIASLVEQSGRLQSLVQGRAQNNAEVNRLERELVAASAQVVADTDLNLLKRRAADLSEVGTQLVQMLPAMQSGDGLRAEAERVARSVIAVQSADQSSVVLRLSLEELAARVDVTVLDGMPTSALLDAVRIKLVEKEVALTGRQGARRSAIEAVSILSQDVIERKRLGELRQQAEARLTILRHQKSSADAIIELGKDLVRQTREARGHVVRRVFNDELNAVWRDLFVRLAPEEPFIPAFAIPDVGAADIEAILETHHRRGGKGGNPRAMLSAGNLNTAALTLFLALHLSMDAKLPMLVIDDPVQSMDEVHIAQFAALLRTLSKQMKRQVIIAVHERSLFDYLALELSPAFEGDRLNIIELGRNAVGQTTSRWDPKLFVADRAIAA
ncbi:DNA replication and repair protein RecF [Brevundimonas sp. NIBR10]|uniref:AAA family ATPase n=1 Tax=Brevundimonas sp. NIBR10 TaxID=3015997 RepID=UPI0022F1B826|nr:AAA family ATPase [Brevundimonas sp. NIBR10]WGM47833.1 DNA replication and repair protein RecF [Brevundimonas sp. NIBR10]